MRIVWLVLSIAAALLSGVWLWYQRSWEPLLALIVSLASLAGVVISLRARPRGVGGAAVRAGLGTDVDVKNEGIVRAGSGGTGGSGGDAIYVGPGVKLNIHNKGVISGGDAGNSDDDV